jgi:membrane protein
MAMMGPARTLGAAIALMIWMWMSTIVILFGAELNSEMDTKRWRTVPLPPKAIGKPWGENG